jgi:hypothetical protein
MVEKTRRKPEIEFCAGHVLQWIHRFRVDLRRLVGKIISFRIIADYPAAKGRVFCDRFKYT